MALKSISAEARSAHADGAARRRALKVYSQVMAETADEETADGDPEKVYAGQSTQ